MVTKNQPIHKLKRSKSTLFSALVFASIALAVWIYTKQIQDRRAAINISEILETTDDELGAIINASFNIAPDSLFNFYYRTDNNPDYSFYVYKGDSLIAWTDHGSSDPKSYMKDKLGTSFVQLSNGYYLLRHAARNDLDYYALSLVKHEYVYENDYLQNSFSPRFHLSTNPKILITATEYSQPVTLNGQTIFYIEEGETNRDNKLWSYISFFLFLIASILLLHGLVKWFSMYTQDLKWIFLFLICVALLRFGFYYLTQLFGFNGLSFFSPNVYASSTLFPSLGDFFVTGLYLFYTMHGIRRWIEMKSLSKTPWNFIKSIIALLFYFSLGIIINYLFKGLVENSSIPFNINNFFKLSPFSIMGIVIVGLMLFSIYYLALGVNDFMHRTLSRKERLIAYSVATVVYIIIVSLLGIVDWMMILWTVVLYGIVWMWRSGRKNVLSVRIIILAILTIYGSYMFEKYSEIKAKKKIVILAEKISKNNDVIAENLYESVEKGIRGDEMVYSAMEKASKGESVFVNQLVSGYFNGYWNRYTINSYVFDSLGVGVFKTPNTVSRKKSELDTVIMSASYSTPYGLHMINPKDRHLTYMSHITVENPTDSNFYEWYLSFEYKFVTEELGFPELLIKGNAINRDFSDYSVARYLDDRLISQKGVFPYLVNRDKETGSIIDSLYVRNDYIHYAVEKLPYTFVISKSKDTLMEKVTDFTYLYTIFGLLFILFILLEKLSKGQWRNASYSLQIKIQTLVISIVLLSLLFFGLGSYYYIVSQNKEKNENLLREKVSSVLIELSHKLEKENALDDDEKIAKYLSKFSNVFFTDINIYALDGKLRASSRPQLFDQGIISTRMHPAAFYSLSVENNSRYTHSETIGNLNYLSSYVPFYGKDFEVLSYLNLPYFAKQVELEKELSAFVVAIINVLVLLFILSAFGALFVSRLITNPLKVIQENLLEISLDTTNKPISYRGKDEIGTLVNAYNEKLDELRMKAEELAKSERETAWREMAKQVAHEIKNPLTPMKLSIQYLQRAWQDKSVDWEDRFNRSTATLIEQIDTLSSIASAFGDFAKMPKAQLQKIDLLLILEQVIALFSQNIVDANLTLECDLESPLYIHADKDQMTRVFNNLIKNAIQSIPEDQEGEIKIRVILKGFHYIVEIEDNGIGIPEDKRDKIFVPNFTTKSTGTGLGLAMVKSIIENVGGKVWFSTVPDVGTSFYVSLEKE